MPDQIRVLWRLLGWCGVGLLLLLSLMPAPPDIAGPLGWDKAQHTLAYATLTLWFWQAYQPGWRWVLFFLVLGAGVELLQAWSGYRSAELGDMLANAIGVGIGLSLGAFTPLGHMLDWLDKTFTSAPKN